MKKYEVKCSNRYYKSIEDLPVLNWWKLHETNDFKWLLIDKKKKVNKYASKIFKSVKDEFVNKFGIDDKYNAYLDKVVEKTLLEIKAAKSGDRSNKIFIDIIELEIEEMLTTEEKDVFNDNGFSMVSKYLGGSVKIKEVTVYEFYSHIEAIKRQIKQ